MNDAHILVLDEGVSAWNAWRQSVAGRNPDLEGANLKRDALTGIDFSGCNLADVDLRKASLAKANLDGANLDQSRVR